MLKNVELGIFVLRLYLRVAPSTPAHQLTTLQLLEQVYGRHLRPAHEGNEQARPPRRQPPWRSIAGWHFFLLVVFAYRGLIPPPSPLYVASQRLLHQDQVVVLPELRDMDLASACIFIILCRALVFRIPHESHRCWPSSGHSWEGCPSLPAPISHTHPKWDIQKSLQVRDRSVMFFLIQFCRDFKHYYHSPWHFALLKYTLRTELCPSQ